jgi:hypothetical protein
MAQFEPIVLPVIAVAGFGTHGVRPVCATCGSTDLSGSIIPS